MSWIEQTVKRVRDFDAARPRSLQSSVGWSEVGGCRAALGFRLDGSFTTDETDTWAAQRGTAIHEYLGPILGGTGVRIEVETTYRGIPGHADIVEPDAVVDIKGLALDTPIPTPAGWTTMAAVAIGDEVFGSDGKPCRVTAKSGIKQIGTYVVRFRDGARVTCDREHLWWVMRGQTVCGAMRVAGITEMAASVTRGGQANWRVPVAAPLTLPDADLPVPPYVLGCWLGDGTVGCGRITGEPPIFREIEREGFVIGPIPPSQRDKTAPTRTVHGLYLLLRRAEILHDRHLPTQYLRASLPQRQALIQGLMDSDGTWNTARHRAVFATTSKRLAEAMFELLCSAGEQPHLGWRTVSGFGVVAEVCHIEWSPSRFNPFRLEAKASQVAISELQMARARWRTIASIERGPDVATACIAVDSPNHTYLCGHEMVPTHNTTSLANSKLWADDHSLLRPKRVQVHGYAAGLVDAGQLPEGCTVRLLVVPVDGTFADWWAYEEPFDRSLADEGADRLEEVRDRLAAGDPLPKDKPYVWCQSWCQFFSLCREADGSEELPEITDPELAAAVAAYGEANARWSAADKDKKRLAPMIRGLRGMTSDWRVSTGEPGEDKDVIDKAAIYAGYAARGEQVPMTTSPGSTPRLTVTRMKRKDAAS